MASPFSEVAVGLAGELCLRLRDRFDNDAGFLEEFVEATARNSVVHPVDYSGDLDIGRRRYAAFARFGDRRGVSCGIGFIAQYCNQRRGIDNHLGRPRSW